MRGLGPGLTTGNSLLLFTLADAVDPGRSADQQPISDHGRGRHAHIVVGQLVRVQQLELVARAHDERHAVLVQAEYATVVGPGGCREMLSVRQPLLLEQRPTCSGVKGPEQPSVVKHINSPLIDQRCRVVGAGGRVAPRDCRVARLVRCEGNISARSRSNRIQWPLLVGDETGTDVEQAPVRVGRGDSDARHPLEPPE